MKHILNHYVLDYNKELASNFFPQSKSDKICEKYFGDYQWYEDGYKREVPYLGMEHQSTLHMEMDLVCIMAW